MIPLEYTCTQCAIVIFGRAEMPWYTKMRTVPSNSVAAQFGLESRSHAFDVLLLVIIRPLCVERANASP